MSRVAAQILLAITWSVTLQAQSPDTTLVRNVNLWPDPSTARRPVQLLAAGTRLCATDLNSSSGFIHVATTHGVRGWTWAKNVHAPSLEPHLIERPAKNPGPAEVLRLAASDLSDCPEPGGATAGSVDCLVNLNKRTLPTASTAPVRLDYRALRLLQNLADDLGIQQGSSSKPTHGCSLLRDLEPRPGLVVGEGAYVEVAGYIAADRHRPRGRAESVTCRAAVDNDINVPLAEAQGEKARDSVVAEPIPQGRAAAWTAAAFDQARRQDVHNLCPGRAEAVGPVGQGS